MTKEQEEAIERLNRFKTIEILYSNTFAMHIEQLKTLQEDIGTVLSMLQEQQEENKKKDKIIDLIINEFYKRVKINENCYIQKSKRIEDCWLYTPSMNNQRTTNLSFSNHTVKLIHIVCKSLN